jgi:hypothetical protein
MTARGKLVHNEEANTNYGKAYDDQFIDASNILWVNA